MQGIILSKDRYIMFDILYINMIGLGQPPTQKSSQKILENFSAALKVMKKRSIYSYTEGRKMKYIKQFFLVLYWYKLNITYNI